MYIYRNQFNTISPPSTLVVCLACSRDCVCSLVALSIFVQPTDPHSCHLFTPSLLRFIQSLHVVFRLHACEKDRLSVHPSILHQTAGKKPSFISKRELGGCFVSYCVVQIEY